MKKTIIIICSVLLLTYSCSQSDSYKTLKMAEQLMEEHTDSAWNILSGIDTTQLKQGEEKALYNLLYAQAQYKLYMPETNDSILAYSAHYYAKHGNDYQKAITYYYKGAIAYDLGKREEAVENMKNAEYYAKHADDLLLINKVYDMLCHINENTSNRGLALKYAKLFLESSILLGDTEQTCRAYDDVALEFRAIKQYDSCRYYRQKSNELIPKATILINRYLSNYAEDLIIERQYDSAKVLLMKADSISHSPYQYNLLGDIALQEKDTAKSRQYWERAIAYNNYGTSIHAYKCLAKLYSQRKEFEKAYDNMFLSDSLTYAYSDFAKSMSLTTYQKEFDFAQADLEANRQQNRLLIALLVALVIIFSGIIFYLIKVRKLKTVVSKNMAALNEAQNDVERLRQSDESHEKEIDQLNTRIQRLSEKMAQRLGQGKGIFDKIEKREVLKHFSSDDEQCFIDYYAYTYAQRFANLLLPYQAPTRRLVTYLLIHDMGLTDKDIQIVLNVSSNTIRSYRHRLSCSLASS